MERTSLKDHEYGGKQLKAGDKFEIEDPKHVPILLAFGRIAPEPGELGFVDVAAVVGEQPAAPTRARRASVRR